MEFKTSEELLQHLVVKYKVPESNSINMILHNRHLGTVLVFSNDAESEEDVITDAFLVYSDEDKDGSPWRIVDNEKAKETAISYFEFMCNLSDAFDLEDGEQEPFGNSLM